MRRKVQRTNIGGEWRLEARLALFAFQAFDQRLEYQHIQPGGNRLLAANVRPGPAMDVDIKVVSRSACVFADETSIVRLSSLGQTTRQTSLMAT
jgi:hypothetical protein